MDEAKKKPELRGALRDFLVMRNLYEAAARQLTLKFEILNDEFNGLYARNPIHHIESRVKTPESIAAKLIKKGLPLLGVRRRAFPDCRSPLRRRASM